MGESLALVVPSDQAFTSSESEHTLNEAPPLKKPLDLVERARINRWKWQKQQKLVEWQKAVVIRTTSGIICLAAVFSPEIQLVDIQ